MKFNSSHFLKWLSADHTEVNELDWTLTGHCVLTAKDSKNKITGLTVFETRSFDSSLISRLEARMNRPDMSDHQFTFYLPDFLKAKALDLLSKLNKEKFDLCWTSFVNIQNKAQFFTVRHKLRVVNIDDSPIILKILKHGLKDFEFVDIVGQISDPTKALTEIIRLNPDVITMDIQMPNKTGVELVKEVLQHQYFPTLMISSLSLDDGSMVFEALNAGAFDYIQKPKVDDKKDFFNELKTKLLFAVESKKSQSALQTVPPPKNTSTEKINYPKNLIWVLGASTGGTQALTRIFTSMPTRIPPTLIVQHIPPVFSKAFADSLNQLCAFTVKEAENGELVLPDHVYIAAGGMQMGVEDKTGQLRIHLSDSPPVNRFKPSVDFLFNSVTLLLKDYDVIASLLTGMGKDGAEGLLKLKKHGAMTLAQDEATSAVFGMPRVAIEMGAADMVLPIDSFAEKMLSTSRALSAAS